MKLNQIKAGIILNYVLIGLHTLVGLLYTPYMLRMLGQNEYGLYSLVSTIIAYLTVLDLGFGSAVVRYTARLRALGKEQEQHKMFGMFLVLYTGLGLLAFVLGLVLYFNVQTMFGDTMTSLEVQKAKIMMLLLVLNISISFPLSVFSSVIQAYEHFVFLKLLEIIRISLSTIIMIALLYWGYKAVALVIVQTLFHISMLLFHWYYGINKIKMKFVFGKINWPFLKEVGLYSFWIFIMIIVDKIYWGTGQFVLGATVGTAAVAVFAIAIQLHTMYQSFSTSISTIFLPKVSAMVAEKGKEKEISDLFIKTGRIQFVVLSFILSGIIIFGKSFIVLWAGMNYEIAYVMLLLFIIPGTIPLIQNMGIVILQARNQMKFRALCYLGISVGSLFMQIFLVRIWGAVGCALAISGALIIGHVIIMNMYYKYKQNIDINSFWRNVIKMLIMPIVFCTIFYAIRFYFKIETNNWGGLLIGFALFSCLYLPLSYLFQMNEYERNLFISPIKKIIRNN